MKLCVFGTDMRAAAVRELTQKNQDLEKSSQHENSLILFASESRTETMPPSLMAFSQNVLMETSL